MKLSNTFPCYMKSRNHIAPKDFLQPCSVKIYAKLQSLNLLDHSSNSSYLIKETIDICQWPEYLLELGKIWSERKK